jgi:hypothetical protein
MQLWHASSSPSPSRPLPPRRLRQIDEALEAVLRQVDGEGVVMMKTWAGSWGQHRVMDKRRALPPAPWSMPPLEVLSPKPRSCTAKSPMVGGRLTDDGISTRRGRVTGPSEPIAACCGLPGGRGNPMGYPANKLDRRSILTKGAGPSESRRAASRRSGTRQDRG